MNHRGTEKKARRGKLTTMLLPVSPDLWIEPKTAGRVAA